MSPAYRTFFGFTREPFSSELKPEEILQTEALLSVADRFDYAIRLGAIALVTGEVGSGKSTALRWAKSRLHPSEYKPCGSPPPQGLSSNSTGTCPSPWRLTQKATPGPCTSKSSASRYPK